MNISKIRTAIKLLKTPSRMILPLGQNGHLGWIPDDKYLKLVYRCETGQKLNLNNPVTFSEKLQWLKLHDRNPEYCSLVDKYLMKGIVAERIGAEYVIPLLGVWDRAEDIDFDALPNRFVLKCNHDSGGVVICRNKNKLDREAARTKLKTHLERDAYIPSREWPYRDVHRVVFAEELLETSEGEDLIDYKFYCFSGKPTYCQVIKDRSTRETIDFYDVDWNLQPFTGLGLGEGFPHGLKTPEPDNYEKMLEIAREFSRGTRFSRIDMYNIGGRIYFGEFTLYPKSGLGYFLPEEWNIKIGDMLEL
ncbi:MAG: ATP-grasp fold amidoligase family protein [Lachnospiraceae bacterium]|nr:ATP-grasp fold amidoligase family protein [Lachnospiraceae bacterium]